MFLRKTLITNSSTTSHVYFGIMLDQDELERLAKVLGSDVDWSELDRDEMDEHVNELLGKERGVQVSSAFGECAPDCFIVSTARDWGEYETLEDEVDVADFATLQMIAKQAGSDARPSVIGWTST